MTVVVAVIGMAEEEAVMAAAKAAARARVKCDQVTGNALVVALTCLVLRTRASNAGHANHLVDVVATLAVAESEGTLKDSGLVTALCANDFRSEICCSCNTLILILCDLFQIFWHFALQ